MADHSLFKFFFNWPILSGGTTFVADECFWYFFCILYILWYFLLFLVFLFVIAYLLVFLVLGGQYFVKLLPPWKIPTTHSIWSRSVSLIMFYVYSDFCLLHSHYMFHVIPSNPPHISTYTFELNNRQISILHNMWIKSFQSADFLIMLYLCWLFLFGC